METSKLKNMVVLRNLPSNIVDEAIVILKPNKKIRKFELVENNKRVAKENNEKASKEYVLKEAEMLVSKYISRMENEKVKTNSDKILKQKYKRLKKYSLCSTIILFISLIFNFS